VTVHAALDGASGALGSERYPCAHLHSAQHSSHQTHKVCLVGKRLHTQCAAARRLLLLICRVLLLSPLLCAGPICGFQSTQKACSSPHCNGRCPWLLICLALHADVQLLQLHKVSWQLQWGFAAASSCLLCHRWMLLLLLLLLLLL
jgi:hypothetical protein